MAVEIAKVTDGLYARLTADSTFNTAIGGTGSAAGRLYLDIAPHETAFPYVSFFIISGTAGMEAFDKQGYELRVQFTIWEDEDAGPRACLGVYDALHLRLHGAGFSVTDHNNMTAEQTLLLGPRKEDEVWRIDVDYFIRGHED